MNSQGKGSLHLRIAATLGLAALNSCLPFNYSPHEVPRRKSGSGINFEQIDRIRKIPGNAEDGFRFALMADTHLAYDELKAAIDHVNSDPSIEFTVIAGDVTYFGYKKEFEWFAETLRRFASPYLVAVGNHDLQANGAAVFRRMFGAMDFSFEHKGVKFVFFDDNAREYACCVPDFEWIEAEIASAAGSRLVFAVSHSPPDSDQLDSLTGVRLAGALAGSGADLSIHGHQHSYRYRETFGDGVMYLAADNIADRNYAIVTVADGEWSVERVYF